MKTTKVSYDKLDGVPLDYALATALKYSPQISATGGGRKCISYTQRFGGLQLNASSIFSYKDPRQVLDCMYLYNLEVTRESSGVIFVNGDDWDENGGFAYADTLEKAVARCVVRIELGDVVDIPLMILENEE